MGVYFVQCATYLASGLVISLAICQPGLSTPLQQQKQNQYNHQSQTNNNHNNGNAYAGSSSVSGAAAVNKSVNRVNVRNSSAVKSEATGGHSRSVSRSGSSHSGSASSIGSVSLDNGNQYDSPYFPSIVPAPLATSTYGCGISRQGTALSVNGGYQGGYQENYFATVGVTIPLGGDDTKELRAACLRRLEAEANYYNRLNSPTAPSMPPQAVLPPTTTQTTTIPVQTPPAVTQPPVRGLY